MAGMGDGASAPGGLAIAFGLVACRVPESPVRPDDGWVGPDGPTQAVAVHRGSDHCDWDATVFMAVEWEENPLTELAPVPDGGGGSYVRDPRSIGLSDHDVAMAFHTDAELPPDAVRTGYHADQVEMWVVPSHGYRTVFLVHGDEVERWPQVEVVGCL
jgi:hypothetical protein